MDLKHVQSECYHVGIPTEEYKGHYELRANIKSVGIYQVKTP